MSTPSVVLLLSLIQLLHCSKTRVSIDGTNFRINGVLTYNSSQFDYVRGLLFNARLIQGIFDDANTSTVSIFNYPDTHKWDPSRNTDEFVGNMSLWNSYGLLSFTVGMQGGGPVPQPYPRPQPWIVSGFDFKTGELIPSFIDRLDRILSTADSLGMVPIVQFFYGAQTNRFNKNNTAINASITNMIDWIVVNKSYTNILIDVANECTGSEFNETILHCSDQMAETIINIKQYIYSKTGENNKELGIYFGSSTNKPPADDLIASSDFVLMHGNAKNVTQMQDMINTVKASNSYIANPKPIVYNEDPNFDFNASVNNMEVAVTNHASWGYYEQGMNDYKDGYQSPPTAWNIDTQNKQDFFNRVRYYTGI